jgi:hypothetical protein
MFNLIHFHFLLAWVAFDRVCLILITLVVQLIRVIL